MVIRVGMFCLLIKEGEPELESSKFGIFVRVMAIDTISPPIIVKMVGGSFDTRCNTEELIPLAENCIGEKLQDILHRENFKIIKSLAIMIHNLQKQIEALQSTIDGVLMVGLEATQEHLREHELRPH